MLMFVEGRFVLHGLCESLCKFGAWEDSFISHSSLPDDVDSDLLRMRSDSSDFLTTSVPSSSVVLHMKVRKVVVFTASAASRGARCTCMRGSSCDYSPYSLLIFPSHCLHPRLGLNHRQPHYFLWHNFLFLLNDLKESAMNGPRLEDDDADKWSAPGSSGHPPCGCNLHQQGRCNVI